MTRQDANSLPDPMRDPPEVWRALQAQRLGAHLRQASRSGLYRDLPLPCDVPAHDLDAVLRQLPLTTKDAVGAAGRDAIAVPPGMVREWVCTSGTSGRPLDVPLTAADLARLADNEATALALAGLEAGDLVVLAVAMERMFVAGLAYWLGAQRLGAACIRAGPQLASHPGMLREILARLAPPDEPGRLFVLAVPTFLLAADPPDRTLTALVAIGEPIRQASGELNALGRRLHERLRCPVLSTYASTETCTSFAEGPQCLGGHLNPALALVEALDEAGRPVAAGTVGEIVVTPLGVEAMPLLRFRTGDMAALDTRVCACGRTTPRIGPIVGRRQQLLKFRGTSIYPNAIIEALRSVDAVADCAIVAEGAHPLSDCLTVHVQLRADAPDVRQAVEGRLRGVLRATPEIRYVTAQALRDLQRSSGSRKAERFVDQRPQTKGGSA